MTYHSVQILFNDLGVLGTLPDSCLCSRLAFEPLLPLENKCVPKSFHIGSKPVFLQTPVIRWVMHSFHDESTGNPSVLSLAQQH